MKTDERGTCIVEVACTYRRAEVVLLGSPYPCDKSVSVVFC